MGVINQPFLSVASRSAQVDLSVPDEVGGERARTVAAPMKLLVVKQCLGRLKCWLNQPSW